MVACAGRYQLVLAFIQWLWLAMVTMAISNHEAKRHQCTMFCVIVLGTRLARAARDTWAELAPCGSLLGVSQRV